MPYIAVVLFAATRPRDAAVLSRAALPSLQECQLWLALRQERASDPGRPARRAGGERKTIAFVVAPPEVKGTGFLTFARAGRAPEQWLYLPDLKRVRQIASTMRNESFVGSDLTYRDMNLLAEMPSWSDADATASLRGEETVDGSASHLIELTPKREDIGYARILLWLGKEDLTPRKLEIYERQAEPRKRITQRDVRLVGAIPVAYRTDVETPQTGSPTAGGVNHLQVQHGLKDDPLHPKQLERGGR